MQYSEFVYSFLDLVDLYKHFENSSKPIWGGYESKEQIFNHLVEIINDEQSEENLHSINYALRERLITRNKKIDIVVSRLIAKTLNRIELIDSISIK